jgi:hypothetical protein
MKIDNNKIMKTNIEVDQSSNKYLFSDSLINNQSITAIDEKSFDPAQINQSSLLSCPSPYNERFELVSNLK